MYNIDKEQHIVDVISVITDSVDSNCSDRDADNKRFCSLLFHLLFIIEFLKKLYIIVEVIRFIENYKKKSIKLMRKLFS